MTNRENFFSLIRKKGYERVPIEFFLSPDLRKRIKEHLGCEDFEKELNVFWRTVDDIKLKDYSTDKFLKYYESAPLAEGADVDIWGVGHEKSPNSMHMTYMRNPLKYVDTLEEVKNYPYPDYAGGDTSHQKAQCDTIKAQDLIASGQMQMTLWETAWYMRSMESLFVDMMDDEEGIAEFLFDKVLEIQKVRAKAYIDAGVDLLYFGDDIGMQHTIMMSEDLYCEWIKPRLKELIEYAKSLNPDIIIFYHSCGFVEPLIPHLIEAGIDVLNPIQSECMDFEEICNKYGDKVSFHGTIGTQTTMPKGTREEIIAEVHKNLDIAGSKGGLLVAPTHMLEPDVSVDNLLAFVEACNTYNVKKEL